MAEIKRTFSAGSMEKDIDERLVPNGKYREALNISVATSEASDVGAAQNILGNIQVTEAIQSRSHIGGVPQNEYKGHNYHVTQVVDPQNDMLYRFIHTACPIEGIWMDRIVEFNTKTTVDMPWQAKESAIMVDIFKVESVLSKVFVDHAGDNKSYIEVTKNLNQLRWGMRVDIDGESQDDITIDVIDYSTGVITLNKYVDSSFKDSNVTFYGDRNLNFGSVVGGDTTGLRRITGVNIIDGMIFWTDNHSEPKKLNIERSKAGCDSIRWAFLQRGIQRIDDFNQHTLLIIKDENPLESIYDDSLNVNGVTSGSDPNTIPAGGGDWVTGGGGVTPPPGPPPPPPTPKDDDEVAASSNASNSANSGGSSGNYSGNSGSGGYGG